MHHKQTKLLIDESAYRRGYEAGRRAERGGPPWFLLTLLAGGGYLVLRDPQRREQLQQKVNEYSNAAQQGNLRDVAQRDLNQVQAKVQQAQAKAQELRGKADKAMQAAKKGQEVGKVAMGGAEPAAKLAEDAATVLASDDPQKVGRAVQDAKQNLQALADVGREATQAIAEDQSGTQGKRQGSAGPKSS